MHCFTLVIVCVLLKSPQHGTRVIYGAYHGNCNPGYSQTITSPHPKTYLTCSPLQPTIQQLYCTGVYCLLEVYGGILWAVWKAVNMYLQSIDYLQIVVQESHCKVTWKVIRYQLIISSIYWVITETKIPDCIWYSNYVNECGWLT